MNRSYSQALHLLNSRKARSKSSLKEMRGSDDMLKWLQLLNHSVEDLNNLNIIHVAGTKGKGSTSIFAESFLKVHAKAAGSVQKTGVYTSPHVKSIRERIRIDCEPISEELFTKRFFEVWDRLPSHASDSLDVPRYLQLLALTSFHVFIEEAVNVAIYETHSGVGLDHVKLLGPSIEDIAWHKAGIFKFGSPALSAPQKPAVAAALHHQAVEKGVTLKFVDINCTLPTDAQALKPKVQQINASLALALVNSFLKSISSQEHDSLTLHDLCCGVEQFSWAGRFQRIIHQSYQWFLNGAHNELSLKHAAQWFAESVMETQSILLPPTRVLIFSHSSDRDGAALLKELATSLQENDIHIPHVIFSTYDERQDGTTRIDKNLQHRYSTDLQECYAKVWRKIDPTAKIYLEQTIEEALNQARRIGDQNNGMQTLVTGSLHLVGGALCLLESATL